MGVKEYFLLHQIKKGDYMKKTRKVLSFVLAVLVAFASLPVVYTGTAAAGTIDNPTLPLSESDNYSQRNTNNLSFSQQYLKFVYYQTIDDEYFKITQKVDAEKYCGPLNASKTVNVTFNSYTFADDDATASFVNNNQGAISWSGNNSDSPANAFSGDFALAGSYWGLCTNYSWTSTVTFKGASADKAGQQTIGYTQVLDYTSEIEGTVNNYQIPITTTITILDARAFVEELAKAESVVANPGNYSAAYVSAVQATLNDIPASLKTLTEIYSQDIIDSYADNLAAVPENAADYTEYNRVYAEYKSFTNSDGIYTAQSHQAYLAKIESINTGLSKALDASQQATVESAIQEIKAAVELLVIEGESAETNQMITMDDLDVYMDNEFHFMQIEDNQTLAYTQLWHFKRGSKSQPRKFYITLDTTDANTAAFAPKFHSNCVETVASLTANAIDGTLTNQMIFNNWLEVNEDGTEKPTPDALTGTHLNPNYEGFQGEEWYYFHNRLYFTGLTSSESGEKIYTYNSKVYLNWKSVVGVNNYSDPVVLTTTLKITDARALVKEYNNALQTLANPGLHSVSYITELQRIVDSVPQDMVNGTKYYTQAEVDALYEEFKVLSENRADYTAFESAYQRVEEILANPNEYSGDTLAAAQAAKEQADKLDKNLFDSVTNRKLIADVTAALNAAADNATRRADYTTYYYYLDIAYNRNGVENGVNPSNYTGNSYAQFIATVEKIDSELEKDLSAKPEDQAKVDKAVEDLVNAYMLLMSAPKTPSLTEEKIFNQDEVITEYTNGVVTFSFSSTEYNFVQTKYDEDFIFDVDFTINNAKIDEYKVELNDLKISSLDSTNLDMCLDNNNTCLNGGGVTTNDAKDIFFIEKVNSGGLTGIMPYAAYTYGDCGYYTAWQTTAGNDLSSLSQKESTSIEITQATSGTNQVVYRGLGGSETERVTQEKNYTYVLRLGWTEINRATGETALYHAHIPVKMNFTDARELFSTYHFYKDVVDAGNDGTFTDASFKEAKDIVYSVDTDVVYGAEYISQDTVTAEMAKLNNAYNALKVKADYSQVDSLVAQAQGMLNDSSVTYTQTSIDALNNAIAKADALNRDLEANEGNNATILEVVEALQAAINGAQEKANYTEFDKVVEELENIVNNPDGFVKETVDAAKDALEKAEINNDLPATEQDTLDSITEELKQVVINAKEKANYEGFDEAYEQIEEILANKDKYTSETVDAAQAAKDAADELGKDQPASNQDAVTDVINGMKDVVANKQEKNANYEGFDEAYEQLEEILANKDKYTSETVDAAQAAKDAADEIGRDQPISNQDAVTNVINGMKDVIANKQEKANYEGFNEAYEQLEEILANKDKYTSETVDAAQAAKDAADELGKDQPASNQDAVTDVINGMQDVVVNRQEKADYTDYNNALDEADKLENNDGNGNPVYDEDIFNAYKDAVAELDDKLSKDLPASEQTTVDEKTQELKDLRTELDATKGYEEDVIDPETTVESLTQEVIQNGGYNADEIIVEFRDYTGAMLENESLVGTGSTMRVILKSTGELLEYKMFIVMGDITGDGEINEDDYEKSKKVVFSKVIYTENENYFFVANDMDADGYIDGIDTYIIKLMYLKLA